MCVCASLFARFITALRFSLQTIQVLLLNAAQDKAESIKHGSRCSCLVDLPVPSFAEAEVARIVVRMCCMWPQEHSFQP